MYLQKKENYVSDSVYFQGVCYDSKFEAAYAKHLQAQKDTKQILDWERQVRLDLRVNGYKICDYKIDFIVYHKDDGVEFVELKGPENKEWQFKWKLLEAIFDDQFRKNPGDRLTVIKQVNRGYKKGGRSDKNIYW